MTSLEDTEMQKGPLEEASGPEFSEDENRLLELFDRLQDLQLQIALVKARSSYVPAVNPAPETPEALEAAQDRLMQARAAYELRNQAVASVLSATPTVHAVYGAANANVVEQDLVETLKERDEISVAVAETTTRLLETRAQTAAAEVEGLRLARQNAGLAAEMLRLAELEAARRRRVAHDDDPDAAAEVARLERQVWASRRRWRVMKGTASAVVVGSGVDWVRDPVLKSVVLDTE